MVVIRVYTQAGSIKAELNNPVCIPKWQKNTPIIIIHYNEFNAIPGGVLTSIKNLQNSGVASVFTLIAGTEVIYLFIYAQYPLYLQYL